MLLPKQAHFQTTSYPLMADGWDLDSLVGGH